MRKQALFLILSIHVFSLSFAQNSILNTPQKLNINTAKSNIKWSADYAFYFGGHYGTIDFTEGHFIKTGDVITGGEFIVNMRSIKNTDIDKEDANASLVEHLKNEDFFDVEKFPSSKLEITSVHYHDPTHMKIIANLTIKGVTRLIDFQAEVDFETETMTTRFKIDRTRWNINYGSKSVTDSLKDSVISDAIGFEIELKL